MLTKRHDRVRILLKQGLAVPVCNNPFTIKLKYEVSNIVQSLTFGIDQGRENIGYGVSKDTVNLMTLVLMEMYILVKGNSCLREDATKHKNVCVGNNSVNNIGSFETRGKYDD